MENSIHDFYKLENWIFHQSLGLLGMKVFENVKSWFGGHFRWRARGNRAPAQVDF